ncbi:MAG: hypothetical protein HY238_10230 [Acidobacteria bacterium]|nr:hypothetical protein [Acidobacteriota bacterium]
MATKPIKTNGRVRILTPEQGRKLFDRQARRHFKMSGKEFVRKLEAGEFGDPDDPYRPELMDLVMQLPLIK